MTPERKHCYFWACHVSSLINFIIFWEIAVTNNRNISKYIGYVYSSHDTENLQLHLETWRWIKLTWEAAHWSCNSKHMWCWNISGVLTTQSRRYAVALNIRKFTWLLLGHLSSLMIWHLQCLSVRLMQLLTMFVSTVHCCDCSIVNSTQSSSHFWALAKYVRMAISSAVHRMRWLRRGRKPAS